MYKVYQYKKRKAVRRKVGRYNAQQRNLKAWVEKEWGPAGDINSKRMDTFGETWAKANAQQRENRRAFGFRGRGDYYSEKVKPFLQKMIPSGTFSKAGGALGGYFGGTLGSTAGSALGGLASKYLGFGDYSTNPVTNQLMGGEGQITVNASDDLTGDLYFSHREFLQNITVSGTANTQSAFQILAFPLNPGLVTTFPFLSQIAQNFVLYELLGCIFEYKPTSGESGSVNNSLGKVIMATSYDPDAPNFVNSVQMENYDYATSCKPSIGQLHGVETANRQQFANMQYIRTGNVSRDKIFTDIGTFQIATEGIPLGSSTTQTIGELWVTYRVKLSRANLYGSLLCLNSATDIHYGATYSGGSWIGSATASVVPTNYAASAYTNNLNSSVNQIFASKTSNNLGCVVKGVSDTAFTITFPPNIVEGQFLIQVFEHLTSPYIKALATSTLTNCSISPFAPKSTVASAWVANATTTETSCTLGVLVNVKAPGNSQASVRIVSSTVISATTETYVIIQCVNYNATQLL